MPQKLLKPSKLRIEVIHEDDGQVTVRAPQLDLAYCAESEPEAWTGWLNTLEDMREYLMKNRSRLSEDLERKRRIIERPLRYIYSRKG